MRWFRSGLWLLVLFVLVACSQQSLPVEPDTLSTLGSHVTSELYFSEYVEGSSNNKALEIFNGTQDKANLAEYRIETYSNGSPSVGLTLNLAGELPAGETFVLAHSSASADILAVADQTSGAGLFNGDDALVLMRGSRVIDSIGQAGTDPGSQWGSALTSTADNTLRRKEAVCSGDTVPSDAFDPATQWVGFAKDTFDGLGSHTKSCTPGPLASAPVPEPLALVPVYEVQGDGWRSPYEGDTITVRGQVVGDFQERDELGGFFVQELEGDENHQTSDGIFVYHFRTDVEVGDLVEVTGDVEERFGLTQIDNATVTVDGSSSEVAPAIVRLPLGDDASWEQFEGMLVTIEAAGGPLVATEVYDLGRGGVVKLADERLVQFTQLSEPSGTGYEAHLEETSRRSILLDDGSLYQNPDPNPYSSTGSELTAEHTLRVGDTTESVTGVISYSWGGSGWTGSDAYRLHPTESVDFSPRNPRPQMLPAVGGSVQVATFNVLNFFNGDGQGGGFPTRRGAEDEFELERQLDKLVAAIVPLDAEVLGLIEIENDGGPHSAVADLVAALNEVAGADTYAFVDTGVIGGDEIKVALVYQTAEVNPTGPYRILNSTSSGDHYTLDPRFDDSRNRPALAQTFVEKASGSRFTVVVNHLKSKGSSCESDGDPDAGDGQGNCNLTRLAAAEALADWAELLAKLSGDPDVLILGDLNAYAMEDPVRALLDHGFENLLTPTEFTYVFRGESGTLDHALASASLATQVVDAEVWSINSVEPSVLDYNTNFKSDRHVGLLYSDSQFRSSDHDPVIIGLDLYAPPRGRPSSR